MVTRDIVIVDYARASRQIGRVFSVCSGRTAVPMCGLDALDDGLRDGLSSLRAPLSIQPQAAITSATVGVNSLQTDTYYLGRAVKAAAGNGCGSQRMVYATLDRR
jgi:hypothetical protein